MISSHKISIINSRQGLYPCRSHVWVKKTIETIESFRDKNITIVSSIGMSTWELVTILATMHNLKLQLHIQKHKKLSENEITTSISQRFQLNNDKVKFIFIDEQNKLLFQQKRDESILSCADIILPISLRPNGNLDKLINQHIKKVDNTNSIPYKLDKQKVSYKIITSQLNDNLKELQNDYIYHWTKTPKSRWYYENEFSYYNNILESDIYPRDAFHTLQNILKRQTIHASSTHMPQNIPTVSFTSLNPIDMIPLFKWRPRYQEMSFEPYGLGIKKNIALKQNIQEVIYYEKDTKLNNKLYNEDIWLTQSNGNITNWENEHEYRHLGDFNFSHIKKDDLILFTRYKKEADHLSKLTGINTISFTK